MAAIIRRRRVLWNLMGLRLLRYISMNRGFQGKVHEIDDSIKSLVFYEGMNGYGDRSSSFDIKNPSCQ